MALEQPRYWRSISTGLLNKVSGIGFVQAVETLSGEKSVDARSYQQAAKSQLPPSQRWDPHPPKPARHSNRAAPYLQKRGISPEAIDNSETAGIGAPSPVARRDMVITGVYSDIRGLAKCIFVMPEPPLFIRRKQLALLSESCLLVGFPQSPSITFVIVNPAPRAAAVDHRCG